MATERVFVIKIVGDTAAAVKANKSVLETFPMLEKAVNRFSMVLTTSMMKMDKLFTKFGMDVDKESKKMMSGFKKMEEGNKRLEKSFKDTGKSAHSLTDNVVGLAAAYYSLKNTVGPAATASANVTDIINRNSMAFQQAGLNINEFADYAKKAQINAGLFTQAAAKMVSLGIRDKDALMDAAKAARQFEFITGESGVALAEQAAGVVKAAGRLDEYTPALVRTWGALNYHLGVSTERLTQVSKDTAHMSNIMKIAPHTVSVLDAAFSKANISGQASAGMLNDLLDIGKRAETWGLAQANAKKFQEAMQSDKPAEALSVLEDALKDTRNEYLRNYILQTTGAQDINEAMTRLKTSHLAVSDAVRVGIAAAKDKHALDKAEQDRLKTALGQWNRFKEQVGSVALVLWEKLEPAAVAVLSVIRGIVSIFDVIPGPIKTVIAVVGGLTFAFLGVAVIIARTIALSKQLLGTSLQDVKQIAVWIAAKGRELFARMAGIRGIALERLSRRGLNMSIWENIKSMGEYIKKWLAMGGPAKLADALCKGFTNTLRNLGPMLLNVAKGFGTFAMTIVRGLGLMVKGVWQFTRALLANPIGLIIALLVALVGVIIWATKGWGGFTNMIKGTIKFWWEFVNDIGEGVKKVLAAFGIVGDKLDWLLHPIKSLKKALFGSGLLHIPEGSIGAQKSLTDLSKSFGKVQDAAANAGEGIQKSIPSGVPIRITSTSTARVKRTDMSPAAAAARASVVAPRGEETRGATEEVPAGGGRGGSIRVTIPVTLDGRVIAEVVKEIAAEELMRHHSAPIRAMRGIPSFA